MIWVIEEVNGEVEKSHADDVAVIARLFDEGEGIAIEFGHDTENKVPFATGCELCCLRRSPSQRKISRGLHKLNALRCFVLLGHFKRST